MRMVSMVIVHPKEDAINDIIDLVNESRKGGVPGLEVYNIINSNDDELIFINFWESIDAFVEVAWHFRFVNFSQDYTVTLIIYPSTNL